MPLFFLLCSDTARRVRKKIPTAGADRCFCPMQTSTVGADRCVCPKAIVRVILKERLRLKDLECVSLSVYYSVALNLYTVIVYSFCSLSLLTFCRAKSYKNARHTEKQPFAPSVRELRCNITQPSQTSHYNPFCFEQGATELAPRGCIRKITPTLRSNILAQWPALNRDLRYVFNGAGFFRYYLC